MARWLARPILRAVLVLVAISAASVLLKITPGRLPTPAGRGDSQASQLFLRSEARNAQELDHAIDEMRARFAAKQEAVKRLLAGESSLAETIAGFRVINSSYLVNGSQPSKETLCRDVLVHVRYLLRQYDDDKVDAALADLQRQIASQLAAARR